MNRLFLHKRNYNNPRTINSHSNELKVLIALTRECCVDTPSPAVMIITYPTRVDYTPLANICEKLRIAAGIYADSSDLIENSISIR